MRSLLQFIPLLLLKKPPLQVSIIASTISHMNRSIHTGRKQISTTSSSLLLAAVLEQKDNLDGHAIT